MRQWKTRFRRYMGWNLPRRRLDLDFDLLPPNRRGDKPRLGPLQLARLRAEHGKHRDAYLEALIEEARALGRYALPPRRRTVLAATLLKVAFPVVAETLHQYSREAGVPDTPARRSALDLCAGLCSAIAVSYKLAFQDYYDRSRFGYARQREHAYLAAFRVLELIKLEQRLRGLRYQALPARAWQDANTLFAVLASYENVDFPLPRMDSQLREAEKPEMTTPHVLYGAIQAFALLDHTTWPVEQHGFIDTYRASIDSPVTAVMGSAVRTGKDVLQAAAYHAGPPRTQHPLSDKGPVISIDCSILAHSIRRDYRDLLHAMADANKFAVPPLLAGLEDGYRVAIASLMHRNVDEKQRPLFTDRPGDAMRGLHIYVGFDDIRRHLHGIFSQDHEYREKRQLADSLADRSALFGEDETATEESLWHMLFSDRHSLGLRTQETQYTTAMGIGSLLAYGVGDDDRDRPRLGRVARIFRPRPGTVLLEIARLARYAEPVDVRRDTGKKTRIDPEDKAVTGFIVFDPTFGWGLLLPNLQKFWHRTPVATLRNGYELRFKLGGARSITQHFILFGLPKQFRGLGEPEYPVMSAAGKPLFEVPGGLVDVVPSRGTP